MSDLYNIVLRPLNYTKRKNEKLFESLRKSEIMEMESVQNYIPIYNRFFGLNDTNYDSINLNHEWFITDIVEKESNNVFKATLKQITIPQHHFSEKAPETPKKLIKKATKSKTKSVFCKQVPLVDPFKFMVGKITQEDNIFNIPALDLSGKDIVYNECIIDENNIAYVDGLFVYLSNMLLTNNNFQHGLEFYGACVGVKNSFRVNIFDDIEYLYNSSFFNRKKNVDFQVDDYSFLLNELEQDIDDKKLTPLKIHNVAGESEQETGDPELDLSVDLGLHTLDDSMFDGVFENSVSEETGSDSQLVAENTITLDDLAESDLEVIDVVGNAGEKKLNDKEIESSSSSCSSRTSVTSSCKNSEEDDSDDEEDSEDSGDSEDSDESGNSSEETNEEIYATLPRFPVELIFMEKMDYTLDYLMSEHEIKDKEWMSILMQIIMILIVYQNTFSFTHNDLHSNNIMLKSTNKTWLVYKYKNKYYKVPTFGRIAKIIDFGRSIYKFNGITMCSDAFKKGHDAHTQYNTEPYMNNDKPRIEPNFSFDLCRLACSIHDEVIDSDDEGDSDEDEDEDENEGKHRGSGEKEEPENLNMLKKIIGEWCLDDNNRNVLYKKNGDERYPAFKLYKMIARIVHRHTPENQLSRPEFAAFESPFEDVAKFEKHIFDIDSIPPLKNVLDG